MNKEIYINTISWIILIALILASFTIAETHNSQLFLVIILLSVIKFLTITFQFVEVKNAHFIWKLTSILLITSYIIGVLILYYMIIR